MKNRFQRLTKHFEIATQRGLLAFTLLCALIALLAFPRPITFSRGIEHHQQQKNKTLICVVSSDGGSEIDMDAVVVVERGKLQQPYADDKENEQTSFANKYFRAGEKFRLTFGGGNAGTATVTKWEKGCNNVHAIAEGKTSLKLTSQVRALATNSETLGSRAGARRAPTATERAAAMQLVRKVYTSKGTSQSMLRRLMTTNLAATDLDGDGKYELVGSFVIATQKKFRRDLFMIADPQGAGYKIAFADYQAYTLPAEGFPSAIDFVDQLDIDGDGVGEVFAIQGGFDAYGYSIYKKQNGRWRKVYSVTGDAC